MTLITLEIVDVTVVEGSSGPDTIIMTVNLPAATFPFERPATMKMTAAVGTGAEYVKEHFGIEPIVV
jgi:hypothetical protein